MKLTQEEKELETLERIDGKYVWNQLTSILNFEKGFFYTVKEVFFRPGKTIRHFISYDRKRLVKPISFIVITSFIYSVIVQYFDIEKQYVTQNGLDESNIGKLIQWIQKNYGYTNIMMGFSIAFFTKLFFKKSNYNFFEIIILICFIMGVGMLLFSVFTLLQGIFQIELLQISGLLSLIYTTYAITDFFDKTKIKNYFKSFASYVLGMISFYLIVVIIGYIIDLINK